MSADRETSLTIEIDEEFRAHLSSAIARFQYLHPTLEIVSGDDVIIYGIGGKDPAIMTRDFRYALYREKIYVESAAVRSSLLGALLR